MARKWQERRTKMKTFEEEAWSTNHTIFITATKKYTKKGYSLTRFEISKNTLVAQNIVDS